MYYPLKEKVRYRCYYDVLFRMIKKKGALVNNFKSFSELQILSKVQMRLNVYISSSNESGLLASLHYSVSTSTNTEIFDMSLARKWEESLFFLKIAVDLQRSPFQSDPFDDISNTSMHVKLRQSK